MYNYIHMYMYMYMYFYRKVLSCTCKTSAKETRQGKATTPEDSYYFQRKKAASVGLEPMTYCIQYRCSTS